MSRISPEWEAVRKTAVAGSTPERGSASGAVLTLWTGFHGLLDERDAVGQWARGDVDEPEAEARSESAGVVEPLPLPAGVG